MKCLSSSEGEGCSEDVIQCLALDGPHMLVQMFIVKGQPIRTKLAWKREELVSHRGWSERKQLKTQCGINKDYVELLRYFIRSPKPNNWEHNGSPLNTVKVQHWSKLTGHCWCLQFGFCDFKKGSCAQKDGQRLNYLLGLEGLQKRCKISKTNL